MRRTEPEYNSYNYDKVDRLLPHDDINIQPQEVRPKLKLLRDNPKYDEVLTHPQQQPPEPPQHSQSHLQPPQHVQPHNIHKMNLLILKLIILRKCAQIRRIKMN